MIDMGILSFEFIVRKGGFEHAYHWTPFAYKVMDFLNMKQITLDDFKKTADYEEALKFSEMYKDWKKHVQ